MKSCAKKNFGLFFIVAAIAACNGSGSNNALGTDEMQGPQLNIPNNPAGSTASNGAISPILGATCRSGDSSKICLGLKYIIYKDSAGNPTVSQSQLLMNLATMNSIWATCNLGFQIEFYALVDPRADGLSFNTSNTNELDSIRSVFDDRTHLLVVTTGTWNRSGTLGSTGANAWTSLPGSGPYGAILEAPVGNYGNIVAHELGHYLNLNHVSDPADLMNPIIYDTSTNLTADQCNTARSAANGYWTSAER